jgi:hypothetical protein
MMVGAVPFADRLFDPFTVAHQAQYALYVISASLCLSLAVAYLALWRMAPDYRVFRNMGIYLLMFALQMVWVYAGGAKSNWALMAWTAPWLVVIAGEAMRVPIRRWAMLMWPVSLVVSIAGWFKGFEFLHSLPLDLSQVILVILIVKGFRNGQRRDRQIAAAITFMVIVRLTVSSSVVRLTHLPDRVQIGGWRTSLTPPAMIVMGTAILIIFVRDLIRDRNEKQRLAAELAASRAVQQVMVPEKAPAIPGFDLQAVYKPHGEVGGDFFQILALPEGGVLIAVGDVSGKGMPAAMMVSLLVGALHALIETTTRPGQLLAGINRCIQARSNGGFTTCIVVHAEAGGKLTMASAGHPAPYLAGSELTLKNGLPLGLAADSTYPESTFHLNARQQLTLLTDGVVEAREKGGGLFGFARAAALSTQSAETIAQAAVAFGQDDDITVLTLMRSA